MGYHLGVTAAGATLIDGVEVIVGRCGRRICTRGCLPCLRCTNFLRCDFFRTRTFFGDEESYRGTPLKKCTQKAQELLDYSLTIEPLGYSFSEKGLLPPRFLQVNICITGDGKKIELFLPLISHLHSSYDRYEKYCITWGGE